MLKSKDPWRVARPLPAWAFFAVPLATFALASTDAVLLALRSGDREAAHWKLVLVTTIPLSAAVSALTAWILLRLRREIDQRTSTEARLRTALSERDQAIVDLRHGLEREMRLRRELDHRVRNNLSSLQGLVGLYEGASIEPLELLRSLRGRISALREVYGLISAASDEGVDLAQILTTIVALTSRSCERASLVANGPGVRLSSREANALAMVVQELVTNASKHGALRHPDGVIHVDWTAQQVGSDTRLHLRWVEELIEPSVSSAPTSTSSAACLGLDLVVGIVQSDLRGRAAFAASEGRWTVDIVAMLATPPVPVPSSTLQEASSS